MKRLTGVLGGLLVLGCTHTHELRQGDAATYRQLNERAAGNNATVTTTDGVAWSASALRIERDSTSWMNKTGALRQVPTASVREVRFVKRGRGAGEGLGIGFLSGALLGAVIGFADGDDAPPPPCADFLCFDIRLSAEEKAVGLGVLLGATAGLVGLVVGSATGSKDVYELVDRGDGTEAVDTASTGD